MRDPAARLARCRPIAAPSCHRVGQGSHPKVTCTVDWRGAGRIAIMVSSLRAQPGALGAPAAVLATDASAPRVDSFSALISALMSPATNGIFSPVLEVEFPSTGFSRREPREKSALATRLTCVRRAAARPRGRDALESDGCRGGRRRVNMARLPSATAPSSGPAAGCTRCG